MSYAICATCGAMISPSWPSRPRRFCSIKCMSHPLIERFWAKVRKTKNCWVWTGSLNDHGYGQLSHGSKGHPPLKAHRVSWELHNGPIDAGLHVLHRCDNPACVCPDHLFLGYARDNALDRMAKGRGRGGSMKGERHPHAKLTEQQVNAIRCDRRPQKVIAAIYAVSSTTIGDIRRGKIWKI